MTAPFGYPPAQYPQQPAAAPQYPQQFPAQQYPAQPQYPAQQYPQAQGYPAPQMAPPAPALAQGSIDDFYNQPSAGGGKSLSFHQKPYGTRYRGIVTRPIGAGDIQQQTDTMQRPQFFKDGRPKFVMKVPLQMEPSAEYPDGLAVWYVKGQARDELVRAMAEVGAPAGPPEAGSIIDITYTGERQAGAGMNPAKQVAVIYSRPSGAAAAPQAPAQVQQLPQGQFAQPTGPIQQAPDPQLSQYAQQAQPELAAMQAQQFAQQYQQPAHPQFAQPAQAQPPAQAAAPQPPADLSPEQQQLLAKLTGG
jgi:hypothetical protein